MPTVLLLALGARVWWWKDWGSGLSATSGNQRHSDADQQPLISDSAAAVAQGGAGSGAGAGSSHHTTTGDSSPTDVRILSHNVWAHYFVPAPNRQQRLEALVRHIKTASPAYDIVAVQVRVCVYVCCVYYTNHAIVPS